MNAFDTHCHLDDENYSKEEKNRIISDFHQTRNILYLLNIGINYSNSLKTLETAQINKNIFCSIGLHPSYVKDLKDVKTIGEEILKFHELGKQRVVKAIGETGLDYKSISVEEKKLQQFAFIKQIELAKKIKKPLIIHIRDAWEDAFRIIHTHKAKEVGGIIHCFTGSTEMANSLINENFYISFSGIVTFKNATHLREIAKTISINRILVETDSPYLAPEPYRGTKNYPNNIAYTIRAIARIRNMSSEKIANITTENAMRIFGLQIGDYEETQAKS